MSNYVFTIIITTYNRKNYLVRALSSVFAQSFNSFEIIVIDDYSLDQNISDIFKYFNLNYIRYVRLPVHSGVSKARNKGIELAKGKYIAFLDDDDEYHPTFLEHTYNIFESKKVDFTWCGVRRIKEKYNMIYSTEKKWDSKTALAFFNQPCLCGLVVSKKACDELRGFSESFTVAEDKDFIIRLFKNKYKFHPVNEILLNIYHHSHFHLSKHTDIEKKLADELCLFKQHESFFNSNKSIFLSQKDCLLSLYYKKQDTINARKVFYKIMKKSFYLKSIEKFIRFEILHKVKNTAFKFFKVTSIVLLVFSCIFLTYTASIFYQFKTEIQDLNLHFPATTNFMKYRQYDHKIDKWVNYEKIPKIMIEAVIIAEDNKFFKHYGIDFKATRRALFYNIRQSKIVRGGSTITQQLAKNLFLNPDKTIHRKFVEAVIALEIEYYLEKSKILEIYLNVIEFGPHTFGISNASLYYFKKEFHELEYYELIRLVSIIPKPLEESPYKYSQWNFERSMSLIGYLKKHLTQEEYNRLIFETVRWREKAINYKSDY